MARRGITDITGPLPMWDVSIHSPRFETAEAAIMEDAERSRMFHKQAEKLKGKRRAQMLALADLLDPAVSPEIPKTPASSRYMRDQRIRVIGAVWKAVDEDTTGKIARFDVIKPSWACDRKALRRKSPSRLKNEFRSELNRAAKKLKPGGAAACSGFLFASIHGDFETNRGLYQIHWHIVATGDWIDVIHKLRKVKAYKKTESVKRPIRKSTKLRDHAYGLTYNLKSYWPGKWKGKVSGQKNERRNRKHFRIPEPYHSEALLWLNKWNLDDLILMMGVEVRKEGLHVKNCI